MHTYLTSGVVSPDDIQELIRLVTAGVLRWEASSTENACYAYPADQAANDSLSLLETAIGTNLRGIRFGYRPTDGLWHYLRLTDGAGVHHYVEEGSPAEVMVPTDRLYQLARKALRLDGRLSHGDEAELRVCPVCEAETEHVDLCDRPYGLTGAVMGGSERSVCVVCEHASPLATLGEAL